MDNLAGIKGLTEMKADFLSKASHELRTPLANIALGADIIRTDAGTLAPAERSNILNGITAGVDHMTKLLDDLLLSAQLQQFHPSIRPETVRKLWILRNLWTRRLPPLMLTTVRV